MAEFFIVGFFCEAWWKVVSRGSSGARIFRPCKDADAVSGGERIAVRWRPAVALLSWWLF